MTDIIDASKFELRKAAIADVKQIQKLVNQYAKREDMLPRSLNEIYENIRDFSVCTLDDHIIAVAALHVLWEDLAEVRSVAVMIKYQKHGAGSKLVKKCLKEAVKLGISKVFALTYTPGFFNKLGFEVIDKNTLPQKIWGECLKCHKFPDCDETAVIKQLS
ncbi:MAG: N-acetyltransferase [Nitrospira sp.]|nr:N-acetyltransferase [bacterium]MBL7050038.1 N-acetyltransferase [Nitrospira sp.]